MLSLNNDFLGYHPQEHNVLFTGSDTEESFNNNLKTKPIDWYYRTNRISYVRNNNGHRCKNIENIDLDNYILFAGCSHTEGVGLKLEDTYPYLVSKKLNCDYYNLSIGGTGIDVLNYNLVTWFSKIKKPPKLLIVQWPHIARLTLQNDTTSFYAYGIWSATDNKKIGEFIVDGEELNLFNTMFTLTKKIIDNIATCPVITANIPHYNYDADVEFIQVDTGRDSHMGVESHKINTESIYKAIPNV